MKNQITNKKFCHSDRSEESCLSFPHALSGNPFLQKAKTIIHNS